MIPYILISEFVWLLWTSIGLVAAAASFVFLLSFVLILTIRSYNRCRSL